MSPLAVFLTGLVLGFATAFGVAAWLVARVYRSKLPPTATTHEETNE